jgi:hypothetical protein
MGFTQPLTEMSTRNIKIIMFLGSKVRRVCRADNLTAIYEPIVETNVECLTSHNPISLHGLLWDSFTLWRRSVLPVRYELDCKYCYK